jgi:dGTPase
MVSPIWEERRSGESLHRKDDLRTPYERDRARVIHSAAFRRLQSKTQILGISEGDFHRTRLTHSMEAAQISRGLLLILEKNQPDCQEWLPSVPLLETICLSHDLGHPPFGHGGEVALNSRLYKYGGFEGNGQTLRQLTKLEAHTPKYGLDLTRRALLGVIKYPVFYEKISKKIWPDENSEVSRYGWLPPKCVFETEAEILEWLLIPFSSSDRQTFREFESPRENEHGFSKYLALDTSLMELADDIAYGVHDLEDAIALKLITKNHWVEVKKACYGYWWKDQKIDQLEDQLFSSADDYSSLRKQAVGGIVHLLVSSIKMEKQNVFEHPLLDLNAVLSNESLRFITALKDLVYKYVIQSSSVQLSTYRGHYIVTKLFGILLQEGDSLLPEPFKKKFINSSSETEARRVVGDYVAGMTDSFANRIYERLFEPGKGSIFERN